MYVDTTWGSAYQWIYKSGLENKVAIGYKLQQVLGKEETC